MARLIITSFLCCFIFSITRGQGSVQSVVVDETSKTGVSGATVSLLKQSDSTLVKSMVTDGSGGFVFTGLFPDSLILTVTNIGYQQYVFFISTNDDQRQLDTISLVKRNKDLEGITIVAKIPPVSQKGDTAQYNASQFKVNPDANAEDLIKKMPGITVDKAGAVTAQGEQVRNVTVDGKKFFGEDASAALKNLPAEVIDKIQVFDRLSDQAQFTGFDDGTGAKSINIVTKTASRNGQFGRVYASYGSDERYNAGGNVSFFKGDRRISLVGLFNNINQQNFASEDLLGVTSSGGGRSGGSGNRGGGDNRGRNSGQGGGGNSNNFLVGQQNGISSTNAFGINYSDKWGKKTEVSGSYFFNNSNTDNDQVSSTRYFIKDTADQLYDENEQSTSKNYNHRINMRFEFKPDSNNSFIFSPAASLQKNDGLNNTQGVRYYTLNDKISENIFSRTTNTSGYNTNNNLLYRHSFAKRGRTLSVNLGFGANHKEGDIFLESVNRYYNSGVVSDSIQQFTDQLVDGYNYSANFSYTEPVGKNGQLQFRYNPEYTKNKSDQKVFGFDNSNNKYSIFDTSLSSRFDNTVHSETAGVSFRKGDRDNMFSIGANYKYTELTSDQQFPQVTTVRKSFNNILPNIMWRKKISARSSINLFYRANTNAPSVTQLQNVVDISNPLFPTTGNPQLKQQMNNTISGRYTYTNTAKGTSFFANVFIQQAEDYITNATYFTRQDSILENGVVLREGAQLSKPVNLNGYVGLRSFVTYGRPVKFIKSNFNVNGGFVWSKLPGLINGSKNTSDNFTYNAGLVISSNISEYVDFNISYNASFSNAKNTLRPELNNNYATQNAGAQLNLLSKKGWFIQNSIANESYNGLSEGFNQSYWLWNAGAGKKFLKNKAAEIKLSVFDILKQNRSITRTVTDSYIEDVQNTVLRQYFLLTFSYKLRNFGVATSAGRDNIKNPGNQPPRTGF